MNYRIIRYNPKDGKSYYLLKKIKESLAVRVKLDKAPEDLYLKFSIEKTIPDTKKLKKPSLCPQFITKQGYFLSLDGESDLTYVFVEKCNESVTVDFIMCENMPQYFGIEVISASKKSTADVPIRSGCVYQQACGECEVHYCQVHKGFANLYHYKDGELK